MPAAVSPASGSGGKESLRTELASARSKLQSLHQEKEHLMVNMRELQGILDKERKELREVLASAKAKIDQTVTQKNAAEAKLSQTEITVRDQANRIRELEDLLRGLRAELASGGSSISAIASAVTLVCGASTVDEVFARQWSAKTREDQSVSVLDPVVSKFKVLFNNEISLKDELAKHQSHMSQIESRHSREIEDLRKRLEQAMAAKAQMEAACSESDARYQAVAMELAKNNQQIHSWRTEERLSMERSLTELKDQLEASRSKSDELVHTVSKRDQTIVGLQHEVESLRCRFTKTQSALELSQAECIDKSTQLDTAQQTIETKNSQLALAHQERAEQEAHHVKELDHKDAQHSKESKRLTDQISEAEGQLSRMRAEILRIEHLVQELEAELESSRSQNSDLQDKLTNARQDAVRIDREHQDELAALKRQILDLESQIEQLKDQLSHSKRSGDGREQDLQLQLEDALATIARLERELSEGVSLLRKQQTEFESEISRLQSDAKNHLSRVTRQHETAVSEFERTITGLKRDVSEMGHERDRLQQSVKDGKQSIMDLQQEIDELRRRLRETAQQLADATSQLERDRNSSSSLSRTIDDLRAELERLGAALIKSEAALEESRLEIYHFKVYTGFEKLEGVLWTYRVVGFVAGFYQWRATAHEGAMQRGADELRDIVGTVDTSDQRPALDDFHIEAFDVASFASDHFGL